MSANSLLSTWTWSESGRTPSESPPWNRLFLIVTPDGLPLAHTVTRAGRLDEASMSTWRLPSKTMLAFAELVSIRNGAEKSLPATVTFFELPEMLPPVIFMPWTTRLLAELKFRPIVAVAPSAARTVTVPDFAPPVQVPSVPEARQSVWPACRAENWLAKFAVVAFDVHPGDGVGVGVGGGVGGRVGLGGGV